MECQPLQLMGLRLDANLLIKGAVKDRTVSMKVG